MTPNPDICRACGGYYDPEHWRFEWTPVGLIVWRICLCWHEALD